MNDVVSVDDVRRLDLRVGEIVAAEPIADARRLLRITVDLGPERRSLVAALAESYRPAELISRQVIVVANLKPATIRGVESHGMLLGVGCDDPSELALLTVTRSVPNGAAVM